MADLSSIFSGSPTPPQPTGTDSSSSTPLWQQQYVYNLANAATNLAQTPYPTDVPSINLTPSDTTQQAWQMAQNNVGSWQPALNTATQYTNNAASPVTFDNINGYANNYTTQTAMNGGSQTGALNANIGPMAGYWDNSLNTQGMNGALNWSNALGSTAGSVGTDLTNVYNANSLSAAPQYTSLLNSESQTGANQFTGLLNSNAQAGANQFTSTYNSNALPSAQDYTNQLGSSVLGLAGANTGALNQAVQGSMSGYENPYTQQVVNGIESSMNTNMEQNVLPSVYDRYVKSGQSASPQEMQAVNNAMYQNQQAIGQAIAPVEEQGYNTALTAAQQAATQGLTSAQTTAGQGLSAGQTAATQGLQAGTTTASQGLNAGMSTASQGVQAGQNAATQGLNAGMTVAGQGAQYGNQNATTALSTAAQEANTGLQAGMAGYQNASTTAQQNQMNQLAAGAQMGQLGALNSQLSALDTGQVAAAGQAQDTITQQNATNNYNSFWNQQNWPYLNLGYASNIMQGQAVPTTTQQSSLQYNPSQTYAASPLQSFVQGAVGGHALSGTGTITSGQTVSGSSFARGGSVRRKARQATWRAPAGMLAMSAAGGV